MKKILCVLLSMLFLCIPLSGCQSNPTAVAFDLDGSPSTLDPQIANDNRSFTIIRNLFEGLFRMDENNQLQYGTIEDYKVSDDGLSYTFYLKEDLLWSDGSPLTARDYAFAFERLFDPATQSVTASSFFCIKNAERITKGNTSLPLGVEAVDDTTLQIELEYPNALFLNLLTTAPAMPCNEEFFYKTNGEYGLVTDAILSNNAFEVVRWYDGEYIKLEKNETYHKAQDVALTSIVFWFCYGDEAPKESDTRVGRFMNGKTDVFRCYGAQKDQVLEERDARLEQRNNCVWGILFQTKDSVMSNADLRKSIVYCVNRSKYAPQLPDYLTVANRIIPSSVAIDGKPYVEETQGLVTVGYDAQLAQSHYRKAVKRLPLSDVKDLRILIPDTLYLSHETYFSYLSQILQKELNLFIAVDLVPQEEYQQALESGNYQMAIYPLETAYDHPISLLTQFQSENGANMANLRSDQYDQMIQKALYNADVSSTIEYCQKAEEFLLSEAIFIPLYEQTDFWVFDQDLYGVLWTYQNGVLDFTGAAFE